MKSGFYRRRDGTERIWLTPSDIETMMEAALEKAGLYPTLERPAVDIERFIDRHLKVQLDQYSELESQVLGLTEFFPDRAPRISVNRDLTGAIDEDDSPPGLVGRWRATLAHEASHVLMHRILFEVQKGQESLFRLDETGGSRQLMRCLKGAVLFRGGGSDWREVQANMGMASLLMPERFFRRLVATAVEEVGLEATSIASGSQAAATLVELVAGRAQVSRQAASIRLETLKITVPRGQEILVRV